MTSGHECEVIDELVPLLITSRRKKEITPKECDAVDADLRPKRIGGKHVVVAIGELESEFIDRPWADEVCVPKGCGVVLNRIVRPARWSPQAAGGAADRINIAERQTPEHLIGGRQ